MQAIVTKKYGDVDVLRLAEVAAPRVKAGQLLIHNHASSVNPIDWKVRRGQVRVISGIVRPPRILGGDFAGEIIAVGSGVAAFSAGERVYGFVNPAKGGAYAQQLCVLSTECVRIPEKLSYAEAASLPLTALTAYQALNHLAKLTAKQHVVINGCSGGVGVMAIQVAKAMGAVVTGICSKTNHDLALALGVDHVVDYTKPDFLAALAPCDVFFDVVSNLSRSSITAVLNDRGCYIKTLPSLHMLAAPVMNHFYQKKSYTVMVRPSASDWLAMQPWIEQGLVKPVIERSYSLKDLSAAHAQSEQGHVVGKLSVLID